MPQQLLYHILGVHGYQLDQIFPEDHKMICVITQSRKSLRCSHCNSKCLIAQGKVIRRFKTVPLGSQQIEIEFAIPRVRCRDCHLVRQVKDPFAKSKKRYTKLFEQYALGLLRFATTLDVARHLDVGWDLIRDIEQRHLKKKFSRCALEGVRNWREIASPATVQIVNATKLFRVKTVVINRIVLALPTSEGVRNCVNMRAMMT